MRKFGYFLLFIAALTYVSCGDDDGESDQPVSANANANTGAEATYVKTETGAVSSQYINRVEMPHLQAGDVFIVHQATDMTGNPVNYSVAYVTESHHSRWVAFRFDTQMSEKKVGRKDYYTYPQYPRDPLYSGTPADDVSFSGYQHGHLCASNDRICSRVANDQTFYMSNMSPMLGRFNEDYWTLYESYVQGLARSKNFADILYVVKGGTISSGQTMGTISAGGSRMPVPQYYFIALLKYKSGNYTAIGFWVEHREYNTISDSWAEISKHAVSIDELEEKTGIDFFCNLPDKVENAAEASAMVNAWKN